jgi:hypothetical protein
LRTVLSELNEFEMAVDEGRDRTGTVSAFRHSIATPINESINGMPRDQNSTIRWRERGISHTKHFEIAH